MTGVDSSKAVAGVNTEVLKYKVEDFKISDQYGNTLSKDEKNNLVSVANSVSITPNGTFTNNISCFDDSSDELQITVGASGNILSLHSRQQLIPRMQDMR